MLHSPTPPSNPCSSEGATHLITGDVHLALDLVQSDCPHTLFHQLEGEARVKLEPPGHNLPASHQGLEMVPKPLFSSQGAPSPQPHPILLEVTLLRELL